MTKGMGNFTGVFAMGKGNVESTSGQTLVSGKSTTSSGNYLDNIFDKALYKTPLNPLLTRGTMGEAFANFTAASATASINSYEILMKIKLIVAPLVGPCSLLQMVSCVPAVWTCNAK